MILKLLMIILGAAFYVKGETDTFLLGKARQGFKTLMGLPIGGLWLLSGHYWWALIAMGAYALAAVCFGYGDKNPWTKWIGKQNAIILTGVMLGAAAFPIIGFWAILAGALSGYVWYIVHILDDAGKIKEPFVALYRALGGLICLIF